jgi:hypothetical protein
MLCERGSNATQSKESKRVKHHPYNLIYFKFHFNFPFLFHFKQFHFKFPIPLQTDFKQFHFKQISNRRNPEKGRKREKKKMKFLNFSPFFGQEESPNVTHTHRTRGNSISIISISIISISSIHHHHHHHPPPSSSASTTITTIIMAQRIHKRSMRHTRRKRSHKDPIKQQT